jgi:putative addiction module killer protein
MTEYQIKEFVREGSSLFQEWFDDLDSIAASKVTTALYRLQYGNFSNVRSVGSGVSEYKIDFGPGYRVYFGRDGYTLIILLTGGTKKTQSKDIEKTKIFWQEHITKLHSKDNATARRRLRRRIIDTLRKPTTQPTKLAKECGLV